MKVLIVGGYGTFGGRLADMLLGDLMLSEPRLTLLIAGRDIEAARRFCAARPGGALLPVAMDRSDAAAVLRQHRPDLVVDASGPFQAYGREPYSLVRESLEAGADYIDLADGADFVLGISRLDVAAKDKGRFALSGMSTFPVLNAAVVRRLAAGMDRVTGIASGIAPSPFSNVGPNVIRAIASYAGRPVDVLLDGVWTQRAGFFDSRRYRIAVPGERPLKSIRFALCDVPDLKLLPRDWPDVRSVWTGAGPTPAFFHRLLWCAAGLVRLGLVPSLMPLAPLMNRVVNTLRWGEHRGGMFVEVGGEQGGETVRRSWHLLAEGDAGPLIPSMAAEAVIRRCLAGDRPAPGARSGHRDLELEDYLPLFARHGIKTGFQGR